ncbi:hydrogenase expression/formation protein HypD [Arcobacter nitrofigilis DSM 7299]|uniref:Hydrogenase expression/formation protein HypD n=1 Tax=Arcobacter nitrofigilis (strain ATCC 33309 / DSM 7299 / CCUG 15893 / LMG 7604 / NCTC 12251 / CI) TaxID=572480 RepID=D5V5A4_ARCNC|nr:hydrogenase formation protein HypD [Arcobacter nitrofigilis]ADG93039.1 hydrogenase expression/formation protein HypD [Arcobacter nitrofigilis DSM 7299]
MSELQLKDLYDGFRDPKTIKALKKLIDKEAQKLNKDINIMEVCGGHTHTIMKYGLPQLLPSNINFVHGPGCPVCVMPKERIDHAYILSLQEDVILVTLGDMIKVPGSHGSLQDARSKGADVRFVYSPLDTIKIANENPEKKIIFFAIGFETTTPMTAALLEHVTKSGIKNILFHINHITVPEPMRALLDSSDCKIDAFIGPSHVSVITGSKIYEEFVVDYKKPVVVSGFEPVDVMQSILSIVKQFNENRCDLELQYSRAVSYDGNLRAQELNNKFFTKAEHFRWRGLGDIKDSAYKLRDEYSSIDAEIIYKDILPNEKIDDHKLCICGSIMRGVAKPNDCKVFGTACKPSSPLGSCMVSSEGACSAYYKYGNLL